MTAILHGISNKFTTTIDSVYNKIDQVCNKLPDSAANAAKLFYRAIPGALAVATTMYVYGANTALALTLGGIYTYSFVMTIANKDKLLSRRLEKQILGGAAINTFMLAVVSVAKAYLNSNPWTFTIGAGLALVSQHLWANYSKPQNQTI